MTNFKFQARSWVTVSITVRGRVRFVVEMRYRGKIRTTVSFRVKLRLMCRLGLGLSLG